MKRLIFVIILAFVIAPVLAMNYTPALDEIYVSGVYSGYPSDTKDKMLDADLGTRWTSSSTSWWVNYTNPSGLNITSLWYYGAGSRCFKCGDDSTYRCGAAGTYWGHYTSFTPTTSFIRCQGNGATYGQFYEFRASDSQAEPAASVNFTCNPLMGDAPLSIMCSAQGTGFTQYLWDWGDTTESNVTVANTDHTYTDPGLFTLRLDAFSSSFGQWFNTTKTDYIAVENASVSGEGINLIVHTYDAQKHAKIAPSNINIQNTTSGTWSNWTATGGTITFTSTDEPTDAEPLSIGQTVKLCGYASGYAQTCGNVTIPYNNYEHTINLIATDAVPTAGNSTLIVKVIDGRYSTGISGVAVTISNTSAPYSNSKLTDDIGIVTFSNIPAVGAYQITASKTGYVSATKYWPVSSGQVSNAYISILPVGATPVPTTGPNGDPIYDPTPTLTDEHGNPIIPGTTVDPRKDWEKDRDMMNILRDNGETLIQFFILCFVLYMIMGIGGKR